MSPWFYLLALVEVPLFYGLAYLGGWPWVAFIALGTVIGMSELYSHMIIRGFRPEVALAGLCGLALLVAAEFIPQELWGAAAVGVLLITIAGSLCSQFTRTGQPHRIRDAAVTVLGVGYIALPMSFLLLLCKLDIPLLVTGASEGRLKSRLGALLIVTLAVWLSDTAAWAIGHLIGRVKLTPRLSPAKTVEGALAGGFTALIVTVLVGAWVELPLPHALVLGTLIAVVGQIGDAAESVIKRDLGLRDFGTIVGPHGGMLDTFDGLLFAAPLTWFYLQFIL